MSDLSNLNELDPDDNYFGFSQNTPDLCQYVSLDVYESFSGNHVSCINYNIRSFKKNIDGFLGSFSNNNYPDVLNLTETWFSEDYSEGINGYNSFHTIRKDRRSGGVSLFYQTKF